MNHSQLASCHALEILRSYIGRKDVAGHINCSIEYFAVMYYYHGRCHPKTPQTPNLNLPTPLTSSISLFSLHASHILPPLLSAPINPANFNSSLSASISPVPKLILRLISASLSSHAHSLLCASASSSPPHPHTSNASISNRSCQSLFLRHGSCDV